MAVAKKKPEMTWHYTVHLVNDVFAFSMRDEMQSYVAGQYDDKETALERVAELLAVIPEANIIIVTGRW